MSSIRTYAKIKVMAGDTVGEIKARLTIADVVASYVKLTKAGRSMVGLCPFHKEKTPSFHVSLERGSYHCFGCGEGGDMFSFVEKAEGVDFKGALTILAEKAGVRVEYSPGGRERADKRERLSQAMARAAAWYADHLPSSTGQEYAKKRGLADAMIKNWDLGYAPDAWRALLETLAAEGFTTPELLAAGLIKEADGKPGTYYDRFRNRLMFPIRDVSGKVVAFTGRALAADEVAKYLNSPETDLYHKSEILFGLDKAKDAIRQRGFTLLVEGQMDALHAHQAGFENTVALSGTALTPKHMALMKRYSDNLLLALDADAAGLKATANAALLALREGLRVKAARLPLGEDPADLITRDPKDFAARVKAAEPIVEFFLAALGEREKDPARLLRTVEAVVLPLIAAIGSPMERERAVQAVARALGLSTESVRASLGQVRLVQNVDKSDLSTRRDILSPQPRVSARESRALQLAAIVHAYPETPLANRVKSEYSRITGVEALFADVPESVAFEIERDFGGEPGQEAANDLLRAFEEAVIREALGEAEKDLRQAEAAGDARAIRDAGQRTLELQKRLGAFHA